MQKFLMALTTAAFLSTGASAQAALMLDGSIGFVGTNVVPNTGNFFTIPSFTFNLTSINAGATGDYDFVGNDVSFGSVTFDVTDPTTFTFLDLGFGEFTTTSFVHDTNTANSQTYILTGTFDPGTSLAGFDPTVSDLVLSFIKAGSNGTIIASASLYSPTGSIPTTTTPEPASIAMFGTMLVPLAFGAFRRRQKAAQAAL